MLELLLHPATIAVILIIIALIVVDVVRDNKGLNPRSYDVAGDDLIRAFKIAEGRE